METCCHSFPALIRSTHTVEIHTLISSLPNILRQQRSCNQFQIIGLNIRPFEICPEHLNGADVMFGGILMGWIDEVAGLTAMRHSEGHVLTASVDNLTFLRSLRQHDIVVLIGRVTYVGNSSMEIRVDSYLEKIDGMRYPVNRAYLTLVALDEDNKPRRVPRLKLETVVEEAEWEAGKKRSELRKQRKKEGF